MFVKIKHQIFSELKKLLVAYAFPVWILLTNINKTWDIITTPLFPPLPQRK